MPKKTEPKEYGPFWQKNVVKKAKAKPKAKPKATDES